MREKCQGFCGFCDFSQKQYFANIIDLINSLWAAWKGMKPKLQGFCCITYIFGGGRLKRTFGPLYTDLRLWEGYRSYLVRNHTIMTIYIYIYIYIIVCEFDWYPTWIVELPTNKVMKLIEDKKTKIALNQVYVPKLALKVKSHKIALNVLSKVTNLGFRVKGWGLGFRV